MKKFISCIIIFLFLLSYVNADDIPDEPAVDYEFESKFELYPAEKKLYPALLGGLFVNGMFNLAGRVSGAGYAQVSLKDMENNIKKTWNFDGDHFLLNHPGHPYMGGLYHTAARSNGFTFYESVVFNSIGSAVWELFGETTTPAMNDFYISVYGGLAFGEIMHRLYLEVDSPLAILISPMDWLNDLIFRKKPARTDNLYYFSAMTGVAWISSNKMPGIQFRNYEGEQITNNIFTGNIGFDIIYGNPYSQSVKMPFEQFEMKFQIGGAFLTQPWLDCTMLVDGYLFSFNLTDTEKTALSNGLTLHYDLITGSNTNFATNSLAYSIKWQHNFTDTQFALKFHLGWILFGSSHYYPDIYIEEAKLYLGGNANNFGMGVNTKLSLSVSNDKIGNFNLFLFPNFLYIPPRRTQTIEGWENFNFIQFDYWYQLTDRFSIGLNDTVYIKSGLYSNTTNVTEAANRILLYAKWTFMDKSN